MSHSRKIGRSIARRHFSSREAFTLIELLVVIGIIGLLTALSIPAVTSLSGAQNLSASGNIVEGMMENARRLAIGQGELVAVLAVSSAANTNLNNRVIGVYALSYATGTGVWQQSTPWYNLPRDVTFDSTSSGSDLANFFQSKASEPTPSLPALRIGGGSVNSYAYQLFLPSGALSGPTSPLLLRLVGTHSTNNYYNILINPSTGRTKVVLP